MDQKCNWLFFFESRNVTGSMSHNARLDGAEEDEPKSNTALLNLNARRWNRDPGQPNQKSQPEFYSTELQIATAQIEFLTSEQPWEWAVSIQGLYGCLMNGLSCMDCNGSGVQMGGI